MPKRDVLSRSLTTLTPNSTLIVVIEMPIARRCANRVRAFSWSTGSASGELVTSSLARLPLMLYGYGLKEAKGHSCMRLLLSLICYGLLVLGNERSLALEPDDTPVADCEFRSLFVVSGEVPTVSAREFMGMCEDFVRSQRVMPAASVLKSLGKVASFICARDPALDHRYVAYQLIAIIESRGSTTAAEMNSTNNIVFMAHSATRGLVTPMDLNIALRGMGSRASGITDEALVTLAATIWNAKKNRGE
jgi:hypothetical protein